MEMTSKERFLAAMRNEIPDRVPVAPDISTYIPTKSTGLPFWDVHLFGAYPLWQAYLDCVDYYGMDAWVAPVMGIPFTYADSRVEGSSKTVYLKEKDAMLRKSLLRTPDGDLTSEVICWRGDPPATRVKLIKNLKEDFKKFKWTFSLPTGVDSSMLKTLKDACKQRDIAFGPTIAYPGFQYWLIHIQDGVQALTYAEIDNPEILQEWYELHLAVGTREMELALQSGVDYILFGGSGTITMASPKLAAKYAIPAIKLWSRMAKEAGVPTMLHSCGKNRVLADMLAEDSEVDMINPLEVPPMGDINLADLKQKHGKRFAFMGNLHTSDVMLLGTPEYVRQKSIEAMRDAGIGGGFVLSTGDQCGRETPDENLFTMVETVKKYGRYDQATGMLPDLPVG